MATGSWHQTVGSFVGTPFYGSAVAPVPSPSPNPVDPVCAVSMSDASPSQHTTVTANIASNEPNATVTVTAHYKTTTSTFNGSAASDGSAAVSFNIGGATIGYQVAVDVSFGFLQGHTFCSTSFTPA